MVISLAALAISLVGRVGTNHESVQATAPVETTPMVPARRTFTPSIATLMPVDDSRQAVQPTVTFDRSTAVRTDTPETSGSWSQSGPEVSGDARIVFETVTDPGSGWYVLDCLPVTPIRAPRVIGYGFLVDTSIDGGVKYDMLVALDPYYDPTRPVLFLGTDADGRPTDFAGNNVLVSATSPFTWGDGDILDVSLDYEAAPHQRPSRCS